MRGCACYLYTLGPTRQLKTLGTDPVAAETTAGGRAEAAMKNSGEATSFPNRTWLRNAGLGMLLIHTWPDAATQDIWGAASTRSLLRPRPGGGAEAAVKNSGKATSLHKRIVLGSAASGTWTNVCPTDWATGARRFKFLGKALMAPERHLGHTAKLRRVLRCSICVLVLEPCM